MDDQSTGLQSESLAGDPRTRPGRSVHRAMGELRRGAAIVVTGGTTLLAMSAETVSADMLREAGAVAGRDVPVSLVVPSTRIGEDGGPVAFRLADSADALAERAAGWMRGLADPTRAEGDSGLATAFARDDVAHEAAAALAVVKLARLSPSVLSMEIDDAARSRASIAELQVVSSAAVAAFARETSLALEIVAEASVPLEEAGDARLVAFRAPDGGVEHLAVVIGEPRARDAPLVRLHSECFTGDFLGSLRCDCGDQLRGAIRRMRQEGAGVLLYLSQEGRGIGLVNKLRAYALQDRGLDTLDANRALGWEADERSFMVAATMLRRLGIGRIRLLTNNPDKVEALNGLGIEVVERVGQVVAPNGVNDAYLATKRRRFGHLIG